MPLCSLELSKPANPEPCYLFWTSWKLFPQVSKSFLNPLEANGDYKKSKLLFDHFLDGTDKDLSKSDKESLDLMISKVKSYYQWDDLASTFNDLATQNCSDMLVNASNVFKCLVAGFYI